MAGAWKIFNDETLQEERNGGPENSRSSRAIMSDKEITDFL
jgi:hypothetical protein